MGKDSWGKYWAIGGSPLARHWRSGGIPIPRLIASFVLKGLRGLIRKKEAKEAEGDQAKDKQERLGSAAEQGSRDT